MSMEVHKCVCQQLLFGMTVPKHNWKNMQKAFETKKGCGNWGPWNLSHARLFLEAYQIERPCQTTLQLVNLKVHNIIQVVPIINLFL